MHKSLLKLAEQFEKNTEAEELEDKLEPVDVVDPTEGNVPPASSSSSSPTFNFWSELKIDLGKQQSGVSSFQELKSISKALILFEKFATLLDEERLGGIEEAARHYSEGFKEKDKFDPPNLEDNFEENNFEEDNIDYEEKYNTIKVIFKQYENEFLSKGEALKSIFNVVNSDENYKIDFTIEIPEETLDEKLKDIDYLVSSEYERENGLSPEDTAKEVVQDVYKMLAPIYVSEEITPLASVANKFMKKLADEENGEYFDPLAGTASPKLKPENPDDILNETPSNELKKFPNLTNQENQAESSGLDSIINDFTDAANSAGGLTGGNVSDRSMSSDYDSDPNETFEDEN